MGYISVPFKIYRNIQVLLSGYKEWIYKNNFTPLQIDSSPIGVKQDFDVTSKGLCSELVETKRFNIGKVDMSANFLNTAEKHSHMYKSKQNSERFILY